MDRYDLCRAKSSAFAASLEGRRPNCARCARLKELRSGARLVVLRRRFRFFPQVDYSLDSTRLRRPFRSQVFLTRRAICRAVGDQIIGALPGLNQRLLLTLIQERAA